MANMLFSPRHRDTSYCCDDCQGKPTRINKRQARRQEKRRWRKDWNLK